MFKEINIRKCWFLLFFIAKTAKNRGFFANWAEFQNLDFLGENGPRIRIQWAKTSRIPSSNPLEHEVDIILLDSVINDLLSSTII